MKRGHWQILLAAVLFLLALGLTLYPVVSNWYIGRHQSRIQTEYREVLEQTDSAEIESIRESAAAYNKTITPGAAEEAYSQASIRLATEDYVNQLNVSGSGIMGYVEIPKIGVDLPIYHGTGADSLDRGTGHLLGSSLPVGGESTHVSYDPPPLRWIFKRFIFSPFDRAQSDLLPTAPSIFSTPLLWVRYRILAGSEERCRWFFYNSLPKQKIIEKSRKISILYKAFTAFAYSIRAPPSEV